ncbi:MAG: hypothetical protein ACKOC5_19855, partial [Chloroflexota bacterium]
PVVKIFTVLSDIYQRTTWQCDGVKSSGTLAMLGNMRLTFTPCFERNYKVNWTGTWYWQKMGWLALDEVLLKRVAGEPTQEKVTYFRYLSVGTPEWWFSQNYTGYWSWGCVTYYWRSRTWRTPVGCDWFYQY